MESQPVPLNDFSPLFWSLKRRTKKCEKRAGAGERHFSRRYRPFPKSRASYFRPPYYLRAWHRLMESKILGFGIRNTLKEFGIPLTIGIRNPVPGQNPEFKTVLKSPLTWGDFLPKRKDFAKNYFHTPQRAQMTKLISFQLSMHSRRLLSAQELDVLSYVYTIPYNFLCRHETLSDTVKKQQQQQQRLGTGTNRSHTWNIGPLWLAKRVL